MNETEYKYFKELAQTLSFSRAAKNLFISQPALSHCIAKLEAEFNAKLFNRNTSSLFLTKAGEALLNEYPKVIMANYQLQQAILASEKEKTNLYIGIQNGHIINEWLKKIFQLFQEAFPKTDLKIISLDSSNLANSLASGYVDIALSFDFNLPSFSSFNKTVIDSVDNYIIVGGNHPILKLKSYEEKIAALKNYDLLLVDSSSCPNITSNLIRCCNKNGIFPKNIKYAQNYSTLCNNVIINKGFSLIYKDSLINNSMVEYIPLRNPKMCDFCAYISPDNSSIILKEFIDFVKSLK